MTMRPGQVSHESSEQYWHRLIREQKTRIDRLESRCTVLEGLFFTQEPSQNPRNFETNEAVAEFLRRNDIRALSAGACAFLADRLTPDWRLLIKKHGHFSVFELLASDYTIITARKKLA